MKENATYYSSEEILDMINDKHNKYRLYLYNPESDEQIDITSFTYDNVPNQDEDDLTLCISTKDIGIFSSIHYKETNWICKNNNKDYIIRQRYYNYSLFSGVTHILVFDESTNKEIREYNKNGIQLSMYLNTGFKIKSPTNYIMYKGPSNDLFMYITQEKFTVDKSIINNIIDKELVDIITDPDIEDAPFCFVPLNVIYDYGIGELPKYIYGLTDDIIDFINTNIIQSPTINYYVKFSHCRFIGPPIKHTYHELQDIIKTLSNLNNNPKDFKIIYKCDSNGIIN